MSTLVGGVDECATRRYRMRRAFDLDVGVDHRQFGGRRRGPLLCAARALSGDITDKSRRESAIPVVVLFVVALFIHHGSSLLLKICHQVPLRDLRDAAWSTREPGSMCDKLSSIFKTIVITDMRWISAAPWNRLDLLMRFHRIARVTSAAHSAARSAFGCGGGSCRHCGVGLVPLPTTRRGVVVVELITRQFVLRCAMSWCGPHSPLLILPARGAAQLARSACATFLSYD